MAVLFWMLIFIAAAKESFKEFKAKIRDYGEKGSRRI